MSHYSIFSFASDDALASATVKRWLADLSASRKRPYFVALSGGRIARRLFDEMARMASGPQNHFAKAHFYWADERGVPPDHAESNYGVAQARLFKPLGILTEHIHRIRGEAAPATAAAEAEAEMRRAVPLNEAGIPVLDLVFLGMGEDGHVASIFPDAPRQVLEGPLLFYPVVAAKPPPNRVTMTLPVLATARKVWILISGPGKEMALAESLTIEGRTPLARLLKRRTASEIFTSVKTGF